MTVRLVWNELWEAMKLIYRNPALTALDDAGWVPTTEAMKDDQLGAVPPMAMQDSGFVCGEAWTINRDGEEVYACFLNRGTWETPDYAGRYMTLAEFKQMCRDKATV